MFMSNMYIYIYTYAYVYIEMSLHIGHIQLSVI